MIRWSECPPMYRNTLEPYIIWNKQPSQVVWAVLENDLFRTMSLTPEQNLPFLLQFINWLNHSPEVKEMHVERRESHLKAMSHNYRF